MEQSSNTDPVNNDPVNNDQLPRQAGPFKIILVGEPGVGKTWFVHRAVTGTPPNKTLPVTLTAQAFTKKVHISSNVEVTLEIWDTAGQERFNSLTNSYYRGAAAVLAVYDADHKHSIEVTLKDIRSHMFDHGPRSYSLYQPHLNYGSASPLVFLLATKTDLFYSSPHNPTQRPNTPRGDRHGSAADASTCNSATSTASNPATTPAASNPAAATEASCPKELALSDNEIQTLCKRNSVLISGAFCVSSKSGENVEETVRGIAELIVKAKYPENTSFEDSIKLHINELKTNDTKCGC